MNVEKYHGDKRSPNLVSWIWSKAKKVYKDKFQWKKDQGYISAP